MSDVKITIRKDVYKLLMSLKLERESLDDLLFRLAKDRSGLLILENICGSFDLGDTTELIEDIRDKRESWRE